MDCVFVDSRKWQIIIPILFLILLQYLVSIFVRNETTILAGYRSIQIADVVFSWLQYLPLTIKWRILEVLIFAPSEAGKKKGSVSRQ